jgi:hypothetical protein
MNLYEVTFSTGSTEGHSTFQPTSSSTQFLKTVVQANYIGQARTMVESMYGGPSRCQVHSAYPK